MPKRAGKSVSKEVRLFPIVGIGSSAGGLEALEAFLENMPPETGMGFVLVPHLAPHHKSIMPELLRKYTKMPVSHIEDGMRVEPNQVYVIPPNRDIVIMNGALQLLEPETQRGVRHPIDYFFRSLAQDQGEHAICIVLSGTGTEGTLGLKDIKGEGGLVIVQEPESASYDGMPRSAITTGMVDIVLPPAKMPEHLMNYVGHISALWGRRPQASKPAPPQDAFRKILALVRSATGNDFSKYKEKTILRRVERRMGVHQIDRLEDYVRYLRKDNKEIVNLYRDLMIGVTSFFRDKEAFAALTRKVLPEIFREDRPERQVRIWVSGCSTGEEAYSIAIACREYLTGAGRKADVQIYATDMDDLAVDKARQGTFPDSITVDVPEDLLGRYFFRAGKMFSVKNEIREMLVFAPQNVLRDPPFSRMDLVSCRNMLIYMGPELQEKLLRTFYYSLVPDGYLFLGPSESIGRHAELFRVADKKWKIFQRKPGMIYHPLKWDSPETYKIQAEALEGVQDLRTARYPEIDGATEQLILRMKKEFEAAALKAFLDAKEAPKGKRAAKGAGGGRKAGSPETQEQLTEKLEKENQKMRESYQTAMEEMLSSNEELQSTNEELQSTNEEMETSKEELQSLNEELAAVNAEHQEKIERLVEVTNDMDNLMASTDIATLFIGRDMKIKRFTPSATRVINLIEADLGRPLGDLASKLENQLLERDVSSVVETLVPVTKEVQDSSGNWYAMKILPYRTRDNVIDGAVLTFSDITNQKDSELQLERARDYAEKIVETVREPLVVLDARLRVVSANKAYYRTLGASPGETEGRPFLELGDRQWDVPKLRKLLREVLPKKTTIENYEIEVPSLGRQRFLLNARKLSAGPEAVSGREEKEKMILIAFEAVRGGDATGSKS